MRPATAAPDDGDAARGQADGTGTPAHQHPAKVEHGGASARPAAAVQSEQQQQPHQQLDTRQPADSARPGVLLGSPKRLDSLPAVSPVQNGRKGLSKAGSGRGGAPQDGSKVRVKPEPPASRSDSRHGADAPTVPSQQGHAAADVPKSAVVRQPQDEPATPQQQRGTMAPGQAKDWASGTQNTVAEPVRLEGDGTAALVPVGLHHSSSSGTTLPLGKLFVVCRASECSGDKGKSPGAAHPSAGVLDDACARVQGS